MLTTDFDFALPADAIAQHARPRGSSRLLVLDRRGPERHVTVRDLARLLRRGDLLVVNDTRVIPARLFARRSGATGSDPVADVELLLVERLGPVEWTALVKPGRRARTGMRLDLPPVADGSTIRVEVLATTEDGRRRLRFSEPIEPHLERLGHVPLPPYIKRADDRADRERYQTVWAREPGAIAAPTAGLHFDQALLDTLAAAGIERTSITLHVGIGTFKPVTATLVHEHRMEPERYEIPASAAAAIAAARARGGRVVAVGTTVVRTLEAAARAAIAAGTDPATVADQLPVGRGVADLFITPGFRFRVVDVLLTNFHLPRSTLLMLVCAFARRDPVLAAYQEAIAAGYHFYSYGDAMLAERANPGEP